MIEVLFGESEAASMKMAKGRGTVVRSLGKTGEGSGTWIGGYPGQVICLGFMLDIGDIKEPVDGQYRRDLIRAMYGQEQWGKQEEDADELKASADLYTAELERLAEYIGQGEPVRIWYSDSPYSRCGFYFLCNWLSHRRADVRTVKLPEYRQYGNVIRRYRNWGEIGPEEFAGFLSGERRLSHEEQSMYANAWSCLVEDNSPLRAVINGEMTGVPEDFYDFLIWKRLTGKPVKQARLIGDILGYDPLGVGDWWYAARIQHHILQGRIKVVEDSEKLYARTISLA